MNVTDPQVLAFVAALAERPDDEATLCAAIDLLQEQGATPYDVVSLYAGKPPDFKDGIPVTLLAEWCEVTEPHQPMGVAGKNDPRYREGTLLYFNAHNGSVTHFRHRGEECLFEACPLDTTTRFQICNLPLEVKRRVLKLFPDVMVNVEERLPLGLWNQNVDPNVLVTVFSTFAKHLPCQMERDELRKEFIFRQCFPIADWIPSTNAGESPINVALREGIENVRRPYQQRTLRNA